MIRHPPRSTLFPSPPLSRSRPELLAREPARVLQLTAEPHRAAGPRARLEADHERRWKRPRLGRVVAHAGDVHPRFLDDFAHDRSEEHTSELQSRLHLVCRLL